MLGLSTDLVVHKLPTDPAFPHVKQKLRKFNTDMSVKIKEEITKQLVVKVIRVTQYTTCYHQILMDEEDAEKIAFTMPWRTYYYRLLKKNTAIKWTDECQEAFDKIKRYLSTLPVLVPPEPGRHLILYLTVLYNSFVCVLGQHDITSKKEQAIYYLSKKFTPYEVKYTLLERTYCSLTWVVQKLKHYLSSYTTYLISHMDPLKYIFQKPILIGRLVKWQILLTEFDINYVTQTMMKAQALADHLAKNPVDEEYESLKTYFTDEEVMCVDEVDHNEKPGWKLFFDGAANMKGVEIRVVLIFEIGHHYPVTSQLRFYCTNNMDKYEACILGLRFRENGRLGRSSYRIDNVYMIFVNDSIPNQHDYCIVVEEELDGEPWFHDIKVYADLIHSPPSELHTISAPWPFVAWGVDVIGPIEPVEAVTFKSMTKKAVLDFVHSNIICRFGIPKVIITDNAANLNSHLMKEVCQQFKIMHRNSTPNRPKAKGAIEAANKNIKKILRKMVQGSRQWHEKLPFALLGYRTKAEIDDDERVKTRMEKLSLIDERRLAAVCHGQLY
ncbi:uncharacterized protein [Nicotiana sylvestris]|uniref:uncharacterized protein n=1 Tax=Nicotiana sylvestris TaxID=4096 RepID=UPI00388CA96B